MADLLMGNEFLSREFKLSILNVKSLPYLLESCLINDESRVSLQLAESIFSYNDGHLTKSTILIQTSLIIHSILNFLVR